MRIPTSALLLFLSVGFLHAGDASDPFAESDFRNPHASASSDAEPNQIKIKFVLIASGRLEGKALDARVKSIVIAISEFHGALKRVPNGIDELVTFCKKRGLVLYDLRKFGPVEFLDGTFKYSAGYEDGFLSLQHVPGCYFTFDVLDPKNGVSVDPDQPATAPKPRAQDKEKSDDKQEACPR